MPGQIKAPVPTGQFPVTLSRKFTQVQTVQIRISEYHDGNSDRVPLVTSSRRTWKLAKRLAVAEMVELHDFWIANRHRAFHFYCPFETQPPFSLTPTGTSGLYIVRFNSDWTEQIDIRRSDTALELIELTDQLTVVDTPPIIIPPPPPPPTPNPVGAFLTVTTGYSPDPTLLPKATVSIYGGTFAFGHLPELNSSNDWVNSTDQFDVTQTQLNPQLTTLAGVQALTVYFYIDNFDRGNGSATFDIFDVYLTVTNADQTTTIYRPTTTGFQPGSGNGSIANAANAVDGNPLTSATLTGVSWYPLNVPPLFSVSGFQPST
jgi:hypothetical protein